MAKNLKLLGIGRNREVFLSPSGKYVVKVPINDLGIYDNAYEAELFAKYGRKDHLAKCRLIGKVLVMEYIEIHRMKYNELPEWVLSVDCLQVGFNRKGQLLAYDYGRF